MSSPSGDEERSKLISDALKLALEVSKEGSGSLSAFLSDIAAEARTIAEKAGARTQEMPSTDFATRGGRLANDALSVALDVAVAAKDGFDANAETRSRNLDALSQLAGFLGSVFIETANRTVGTTGPQPATNRARLVMVEVESGHTAHPSAWVVNRGAAAVENAAVTVLEDGDRLITAEPATLDIRPGGRAEIKLTVTGPAGDPGSFTDALLLVKGVGSIVVRTIVKAAANPPSDQA
jgi:hypothetical protein